MSIKFPSGGHYISQTNQPPLNAALSMTAWAKIAGADTNTLNSLWWRQQTAPAINEFIILWAGAGPYLKYEDDSGVPSGNKYSDGTGGGSGTSVLQTVTAGLWFHVGWTRSGTTNKIYYNGIEVINSTGSSGNLSTANTNWIIGGDGGNDGNNDYLNGSVAGLKVWSATLTATDIANEMAYPEPSLLTNIWGWWPFKNATDLNDQSGNGRHFTATGTPTSVDGDPPYYVRNRSFAGRVAPFRLQQL